MYTPHANFARSDHTDFSESTEEIAPLTEEEKKARLEELRQKLQEKRANQSVVDKEEAKRNEVCRSLKFTTGKGSADSHTLANPHESHQGVPGHQGGARAQGAD